MTYGIKDPFGFNKAINWDKLEDPEVLKELEKIFKFFGDEKEAKFIARNIIKERSKNQIDTKSLVEIIDKSKKRKNSYGKWLIV